MKSMAPVWNLNIFNSLFQPKDPNGTPFLDLSDGKQKFICSYLQIIFGPIQLQEFKDKIQVSWLPKFKVSLSIENKLKQKLEIDYKQQLQQMEQDMIFQALQELQQRYEDELKDDGFIEQDKNNSNISEKTKLVQSKGSSISLNNLIDSQDK